MGLFETLRRNGKGATGASAETDDLAGCLTLLSASELLAPHQPALRNIRQQVGVPDAHWDALYRPLFERFALFAQRLPASEAHHHRQAGGLLTHTIDVTLKALTIRRGVLLPSHASAEELAEKQDVWTYGTVSAALLHDLGKPVVDQIITRYDVGGRILGHWSPLAGPMAMPATHYSIQFRRGRRYRLHPRLPPMLAHHFVPALAMEWLVRDLEVFEAWLATISGGDTELAGELGRIIRQADGLSAAADLSGNGEVAVGARRSLGERMAAALRRLIDEQMLPLNKPGAAGFVIGDDLWLVSKRALDALRDELSRESPAGIPTRNERLMDELQAYGLLTSNGDRAIWHAIVELPDWQHRLTLLRVPLTRLWSDPTTRPPAVAGTVSAEDSGKDEVAADFATPASGSPSPPSELSADIPATTSARDDTLSSLKTPQWSTDPGEHDSPDDRAAPRPQAEGDVLRDNEVIRWLIDGITSGRLKLNAPDARLHTTQEGLLLVSPGIFRDFAGVEGWLGAQKRLLKHKAHLKRPDDTNIWTYRVVGERKTGARLKGIVLPDTEKRLGLRLPSPNPHLMLIEAPAMEDDRPPPAPTGAMPS